MSNYKGYTDADNVLRKLKNTTEKHYDAKVNTNSKKWTTSKSAMSEYLRKKLAKEHTSKVKVWTQEEIDALNNKRSA